VDHGGYGDESRGASRVAERFITREDCPILIGALHSGVANAITQVAAKYGTIYLNTNSSAPSEAAENCARVKFVWDGNGTNFAKAAVRSAVKGHRQELAPPDKRLCLGPFDRGRHQGGNRGRRRARHGQPARAAEHARLHGLLAQGTAGEAGCVAAAIGGDDIKALRQQVAQLKLDGKPAWINNQQDWPDVYGQPESLFGVFGTTWYHKLQLPGVAEFVEKWKKMAGPGAIPVPGNVSYNGYMATRELLRTIERAGTTTTSRSSRRSRP
jgi:branched-chain amino acid transport system substrate-binding protein